MAKAKRKKKTTKRVSTRCSKCGVVGSHNIGCPRNIANQKWHSGTSILGRNWRNEMV